MKNNKSVYVIALLAILLVSAVGVSFAYFTGNNPVYSIMEADTVLDGGKMIIDFTDKNPDIKLSDLYPGTPPVGSKQFSLSGLNTTDLNMGYHLYLVVTENGFDNGELKYTLGGSTEAKTGHLSDNVDVSSMKDIPSTIGVGTKKVDLGRGLFAANSNYVLHNYAITFYFPETGVAQNGQGARFAAYISIEAEDALTIE